MSTDRETGIRPGGDNEPGRSAPMRLGAERPRVTRLSRKVLAGAAAVGSVAFIVAARANVGFLLPAHRALPSVRLIRTVC